MAQHRKDRRSEKPIKKPLEEVNTIVPEIDGKGTANRKKNGGTR
jgi:hypothetical protein